MFKTKKVFGLLFAVLSLVVFYPKTTLADADPVNIHFEVEGPGSTLYNGDVSVPPCTTPNNTNSTVNGFCAFDAAGLSVDATWSSYGGLINSIGGTAGDASNFWLWFLNGEPAQVGIDSYMLKSGDSVLWALGKQPLKVSVSTNSPKVNASTTVTVLGFNPNSFNFEPLAGASIVGSQLVTDSNGKVEIFATSTTPFSFNVTASGYLPSQTITITPVPESVTLTIRGLSTVAYTGTVNLPDPAAPNVQIAPTNSATTLVSVSPRSLLAVLDSLQANSTAFKITDLGYYSSFNSFIINCIAVPASGATPDCYNWTDAINGSYPQVGTDHQILKDGDVVYVFFGSEHKVTLSKNSVDAGASFNVKAEQYDLTTGQYLALPNAIVGVGVFNSDFSFSEKATSTTDSTGLASFTITEPGKYQVGLRQDFYFPSVDLTVNKVDGGSGGGNGVAHINFDIAKAIGFINNNQKSDGSFGSDFATDWTALAFAAQDPGVSKSRLKDYLIKNNLVSPSITDYERRSMALSALGVNPYSGASSDYITPIINSFDGKQIGSPLDNDDIFGLIVLQKAGYNSSDTIIQKVTNFVLQNQKADGSWDESVDMTAAAIQAIGPLFDLPGVNSSLGKAGGYLKTNQQPDAGWGNIDSTSWVQTAINGMIESRTRGFDSEAPWGVASGLFPTDYLGKAQKQDGGVESSDRVWSTSYALVGASQKSWVSLLSSFSKPASGQASSGAGKVLGDSTTTLTTLIPDNLNPKIKDSSTTPEQINILNNDQKDLQKIQDPMEINQSQSLSQNSKPIINRLPIKRSTAKRSNRQGAGTLNEKAINKILFFLTKIF